MKPLTLLLLLVSILATAPAQTPVIPTREIQIQTALLAAPPESREGAMVYGYDAAGVLVVLRPGTNNMICLADDPATPGFSAASYHKDLEPFMARGRELQKEKKTAKQIFDIREEEVKSGRLPMPKSASTLAVYYASPQNYNPLTGEVKGDIRYVVYIPYATAESTGLPLKPEVPGGPWIMDAGTHRAHIMLTPPARN